MAADFQKTFRRYGKFYQSTRKYMQRKEVLVSTNVILTLFTVSFFAAFAIRPTALTITRLWREISDKRTVRSQLEAKIADLEEAQTALSEVEGDLSLLDSALPATPEFSRLVRLIEYLAFRDGLVLASSRISEIDLYVSEAAASGSAAQLTTHPFAVTLRGSYANIRTFLSDLHRLDRTVSVRSISIRSSKKQGGGETYDLELSVDADVFSYPEGKAMSNR